MKQKTFRIIGADYKPTVKEKLKDLLYPSDTKLMSLAILLMLLASAALVFRMQEDRWPFTSTDEAHPTETFIESIPTDIYEDEIKLPKLPEESVRSIDISKPGEITYAVKPVEDKRSYVPLGEYLAAGKSLKVSGPSFTVPQSVPGAGHNQVIDAMLRGDTTLKCNVIMTFAFEHHKVFVVEVGGDIGKLTLPFN